MDGGLGFGLEWGRRRGVIEYGAKCVCLEEGTLEVSGEWESY